MYCDFCFKLYKCKRDIAMINCISCSLSGCSDCSYMCSINNKHQICKKCSYKCNIHNVVICDFCSFSCSICYNIYCINCEKFTCSNCDLSICSLCVNNSKICNDCKL